MNIINNIFFFSFHFPNHNNATKIDQLMSKSALIVSNCIRNSLCVSSLTDSKAVLPSNVHRITSGGKPLYTYLSVQPMSVLLILCQGSNFFHQGLSVCLLVSSITQTS